MILDPSAVSLRAELRKRKREAKRSERPRNWAVVTGKNDLLPGIRFCASQLEHGLIVVAEGDCNEAFRKEQQDYSWSEEDEDTPIEVNAHTLAAFRYVAYTRLGRRRSGPGRKPRGV